MLSSGCFCGMPRSLLAACFWSYPTGRALVLVDFILLTLMIAMLSCAYLLVEQLVRNQTFSKSRRVSHG